VPAGTVLTPYTGPLNISTSGTVIDDALISGCLYIAATNVTIENSVINNGSTCFAAINIATYLPTGGLLVSHVTMNGFDQPSGGTNAETYAIFSGSNVSVDAVNIYGFSEPIASCGNLTLTNSYIHDLFVASWTHNEDLYCGGTGALTIRHNRLENQNNQTATVALFGDFAAVQNMTIDDNLLNGGGYTIYGGHDSSKAFGLQDANVKITNNHFMRTPEAGAFWPNGGYFGPVTAFDSASPGNVWSGNVWDDNGAIVPPGG
jgi:hypothetical protein